MIANTADMDIKPGAMGKPLPGIEAGIVTRDGDSVTRTARRRDRRTGAAPRLAVDDARPIWAGRNAMPNASSAAGT
jgi:acyl-coenzyme A synthetase/AMP-(fatty) acid ligase